MFTWLQFMNLIEELPPESYLPKADLAFTPNLFQLLQTYSFFYFYLTLKCKNHWVKGALYIYIYIQFDSDESTYTKRKRDFVFTKTWHSNALYQWWQCLPLVEWHWGGVIEVYLQYTFSSIQATCCSTYVDLSVHQVHQDISNISLFYITRCSMGNDEKKHLSRRLQISLTN